jgi:hypothetical protein
MLHQQKNGADKNDERREQHAQLQQSADDLLDCVVADARRRTRHNDPVSPLYNISAAMTITTPMNT